MWTRPTFFLEILQPDSAVHTVQAVEPVLVSQPRGGGDGGGDGGRGGGDGAQPGPW